jgi:hypothetical protein
MHGLMLLVALALNGDGSVGPSNDQTRERPAPRPSERRLDVVLQWNEHALEAIRRDRTPPPLAARNLAILHAAVADATAAIYQTYRPFRVDRPVKEPTDVDTAVAVTAHRVLVSHYPRQRRRLDDLLDRALDAVPAGAARSRGIGLGRFVADRYLAWRRDDTLPRSTSYRPSLEIGLWRPTPPARAQALLPDWGKTPPFGVRSARSFRPAPPPELTSRDYALELNEVKRLGERNSTRRKAEQSIIAWFWDDGAGTCTPPGHWNQIAQEVALQRKLVPWENARLFALLNIALADAGIVCWDCKYHFRLWRPITAIHEADRDNNPDTHRDARWQSLLITPPFPSYTSGHSTFSGAAAAILARFFGTDRIAFEIRGDGFPGTRRSFERFSQAAREAGMSRIYGGIHYECDNREGLALGKAVAEEVYRAHLQPDRDQARRLRRERASPLTVSVRRE